jgi:hypothetical protein
MGVMPDPSAPATSTPAQGRLPLALYILAGLLLLKAMLVLPVVVTTGLVLLQPVTGLSPAPEAVAGVVEAPLAAAGFAAYAVLLLLSALGMLLRRRLGWLLAMVVTGLFVAIDIFRFSEGSADHFWMGLNVIIVFYLNQRDVREVVGAATSRPMDGDEAFA